MISIIIATFNAAKVINVALESIINQTFQDWECIIIDGGSCDETINIIKECKEKDGRISYISEKDKGIYDAFNKGWKLAKGEWIYYLGADDVLLQNALAEVAGYFDKANENTAIVSGGVKRIRQDGTEKLMYSHEFVGSHQSMLTRRSVLEKLGGFDLNYKIIADFDLFTRIKNAGYVYLNVPVLVAEFHAGGTSENLKNSRLVLKEKLDILKKDKYCKYPLFAALRDCFRTFVGSIIHRSNKI